MSFTKIEAEDLAGRGVAGLPDAPGFSAEEMQRRLDEIAKEVIVPAFNRLVDELGAEDAAALIGAKDGDKKSSVQAVLGALKKYVDDKIVAVGAADMVQAVYDPHGEQRDVYEYAREQAAAAGVCTMSHVKSGSVHSLAGLDGRAGVVQAVFRASAGYAEGESFLVDGEAYTAARPDGETVADGTFAAGALVSVVLDTGAKTVNFKGGGGVKLPALTNPAAAAQIFKGYQAIDSAGMPVEGTALAAAISAAPSQVTNGKTYYDEKGELKTGTAVQYFVQSGSKTVTEDDVEEGTYTKFTVTATGSVIDLASAWIYPKGASRTRLYVALIVDGTVVKEDVGDYHMNSISLSGRKISFSIADDEVLDYGDYIIHWKVVSH